MKLAISGWREMPDNGIFEDAMTNFIVKYGIIPSVIITGGARGQIK